MMKKLLATIIALSIGLVACGTKEPANEAKLTASTEELAPPIEGKIKTVSEDSTGALVPSVEEKTGAESKEKGLVIVDEQGVLKGYAQVPVLFNSYGVWIDEQGEPMADKVAQKVFAEQPVYAEATIRFNEKLIDLDTPQREILLSTYRPDGPKPIEESDNVFIQRRLNGLVEQWKHDQSFLEQISPEAEGAYELYNEILGLDPEPVPISQDVTGDWYDQNGERISDSNAAAWFANHPQCAELTQALMERAREKDMLRYASYLTRSAFRLGYAWKIGGEGYYAHFTEKEHDSAYVPPSDYKWWRKELVRLKEIELPEFTSEPIPREFFETPMLEKPEKSKSESISVADQPIPDISTYEI